MFINDLTPKRRSSDQPRRSRPAEAELPRVYKGKLVLDITGELLVVTSRVGMGGAGNVRRETQTPAVGEVRWRAETVGPEFRVHLVLGVQVLLNNGVCNNLEARRFNVRHGVTILRGATARSIVSVTIPCGWLIFQVAVTFATAYSVQPEVNSVKRRFTIE